METSKLNNSRVSTSAQLGEGGSIIIASGQSLVLSNQSAVRAESSGAGNSGTVDARNGRRQFFKVKTARSPPQLNKLKGVILPSPQIKM